MSYNNNNNRLPTAANIRNDLKSLMKRLATSGGGGGGGNSSLWSNLNPKTSGDQLVEWADWCQQSGRWRKSDYWPNEWLMPGTGQSGQKHLSVEPFRDQSTTTTTTSQPSAAVPTGDYDDVLAIGQSLRICFKSIRSKPKSKSSLNLPKQLPQQQQQTTDANVDCKSVIRGLDTTGVDNLTKFIRQLVNNLMVKKVNGSSILSATAAVTSSSSSNSRKHTTGGGQQRLTIFVTADSQVVTRSLIRTAQLNGIDWTEYYISSGCRKKSDNVTKVVANSKCISVVRDLDITAAGNLTGFVRQLVESWPKGRVNGAMILSVRSNAGGKRPTTGGKQVTLFVTACSPEANRALIENGKHYGINWCEYREPKKLVNQQPINVRQVVTNNSHNKSSSAAVSQLVADCNEPNITTEVQSVEQSVVDCKSVIRGLDTTGVDNLTKFVRQLVNNLKIKKINGSSILSVMSSSNSSKHTTGGGQQRLTLFVMASSQVVTRSLIKTAQHNGIDWTEYYISSGCRKKSDNVHKVVANSKCISVVRGLDISAAGGVGLNLTGFVRFLVESWPSKGRVNSAMIMSVRSNAGKRSTSKQVVTLFVTACSPEATCALIETGKLNGINWSEYMDPKQLDKQREIREVVVNSKRISVISGLDTTIGSPAADGSSDPLAAVRQLVADWNQPNITTEMVKSVEQNTILTASSHTDTDNHSRPFFYVMAKNAKNNSLLLKTAAEKYNSSTGSSSMSSISWLPHSYRYHYDPISGQSYTLCITGGLADTIDGVTDLTDFVRQLVDNWNDNKVNGSQIVSVEPYVEKLPVLHNTMLYVRTVSPMATNYLIKAFRSRHKHIKCHVVKHSNVPVPKNKNIPNK